MGKFAEFVRSGKNAKKFIEDAQTSDSISSAIGVGGITHKEEEIDLTGIPPICDPDLNPASDDKGTNAAMTEETDALGSGPAPTGSKPEPQKDVPLAEGDALGTGPAPEGTNPDPQKDVPLPEKNK